MTDRTAEGAPQSLRPDATEALPLHWRHVLVFMVVFSALLIDGLDMQLLSFVAPVIVQDWGIDRAALGPALSAALVGMGIGASLGGWLGDRAGVKRVLFWSVVLFGVTTLVASLVADLHSLAVLRLISGIGFGAATPNGIALVVDWMPPRFKNNAVAVLVIANPLGGMFGAAAVAAFIETFGWRACFTVTAIVSLVIALIMMIALPESRSFLIRTGKAEKARRLTSQMFGDDAAQTLTAPAAQKKAVTLPAEYRRAVLCAGLSYMFMIFVSLGIGAWAPIFLTGKGFSLTEALGASFGFNLLAVIGSLLCPLFLHRMGSRMFLALINVLTFAGAAALAAWLALLPPDPDAALVHAVQVGLSLVGGFSGAAVAALVVVLSQSVAQDYRSTALGFAMMLGRVGGFMTLIGGGALISMDAIGLSYFFSAILVAVAGSLIAVLAMDRHLPKKVRA